MTIKDYNKLIDIYTLDLPNKEVRLGLMESLLPAYIPPQETESATSMVAFLYEALTRDDLDGALRLLQEFLSTVPYCDHTNYEGHYQQVFYIIFSLLGAYVDVEVRTDRPEAVSRAFRLVRPASGESRHQLRCRAAYPEGLENSMISVADFVKITIFVRKIIHTTCL